MLLHPVAQLSWTSFNVHISTVIGIAALGAAYAWRARRGPSALPEAARDASHAGAPMQSESVRGVSPSIAQRLSFYGALTILFFTLNGPLHDLSDSFLFSAHMVQHLVLTLIIPPLLVLGVPGWMLRPLLQYPILNRIARAITPYGACFAIFNVILAFWHLPPMYNLALANHPIHIVQHLMFLAGAVLMWWPLTSPLPELPRAPYPMQMLYCFLMVIPMSVISVYIVMADSLLYPLYATAPRIMGITPMEDQQLGGLVMWIPGGIFFYAVMTVVFFKWVRRDGDDEATAQTDFVAPTV